MTTSISLCMFITIRTRFHRFFFRLPSLCLYGLLSNLAREVLLDAGYSCSVPIPESASVELNVVSEVSDHDWFGPSSIIVGAVSTILTDLKTVYVQVCCLR